MVSSDRAASVQTRTLSKCDVPERRDGQFGLQGGLRVGHYERAVPLITLPVIVVLVRVAGRVVLPMVLIVLSMVLIVLSMVLIVVVTITSRCSLDGLGGLKIADGIRVDMVHATPCQHVPQDGAKRGYADQAVHESLGIEKDRRFHRTRCSNLRRARI